MEIKEAIKIIKRLIRIAELGYNSNPLSKEGEHTTTKALTLAIAALEKLEAIKSCTPPSDDWEHYADRLHDIAYQSGYEQGKKDAGKWIPVSEALPEDYTDVLVWFEYFRYGSYNCMYQTYGIGDYSAKYESWTINHETGWKKLRVIAWRPMPEVYQEDKA